MKTKKITKIQKVKTRILWGFNPSTRVIKNRKIYSRKNFKLEY